jgi:hypothetical protein
MIYGPTTHQPSLVHVFIERSLALVADLLQIWLQQLFWVCTKGQKISEEN